MSRSRYRPPKKVCQIWEGQGKMVCCLAQLKRLLHSCALSLIPCQAWMVHTSFCVAFTAGRFSVRTIARAKRNMSSP